MLNLQVPRVTRVAFNRRGLGSGAVTGDLSDDGEEERPSAARAPLEGGSLRRELPDAEDTHADVLQHLLVALAGVADLENNLITMRIDWVI